MDVSGRRNRASWTAYVHGPGTGTPAVRISGNLALAAPAIVHETLT
jgi:hypothetical protein